MDPTHIACTSVRNASSRGSSRPVSCAWPSIEATAGALVNVTASRSELMIWRDHLIMAEVSRGGSQRYTGIGSTAAPASRSTSQKSGNGSHSVVAPCSWTRYETFDTLVEQMTEDLGLDDSLAGDHSSRSPAGPDGTFGLRSARKDPVSAPATSIRLLGEAPASAASIQPRKPIPVVATTMSGGSATSAR